MPGLRIKSPNRNSRRQRYSEAEQIALASEIVPHESENEDGRLQEALYHKMLLQEAATRDPSDYIGVVAEQVSPPNPFIRFARSPEVHIVSPLSYHTLTPNEKNSPMPRIRFGSKRKRKGSRKLNLTKVMAKFINSRKKGKNVNLVKLINRTLRQRRKYL